MLKILLRGLAMPIGMPITTVITVMTIMTCVTSASAQPDMPGPITAPAPLTAATPQPDADAPIETADPILEALEADRRVVQENVPRGARPQLGSGPGDSMNPDISFILDIALAAFTTDEPLQLGAHDPSENGFNFQQLEMAISKSVDPYFRFDGNLVFSPFGVEIEEAYATTLALPWNLQARVGQFLTRFGRFNNTHPHAWLFLDLLLVHGKYFGPELNRGLGAEASVLLPLPWYVEVLASGTDARGAATARSFYGGENVPTQSPADLQYTLAAKQFFPLSDDWSAFWGLSAALGPNATGRDNRTDIYGTDLYLKWRPITEGRDYRFVALQAELLQRRRQVPGNMLMDHGAYAYLIWHFAQRWQTGLRQEWVAGLENDPLDPEWDSDRQRTSAQLTFFPTEFSRIRAQVNHDRPGWTDAYWGAFLGFEVSVGAHGAHTF
jgi:hypothetical protein